MPSSSAARVGRSIIKIDSSKAKLGGAGASDAVALAPAVEAEFTKIAATLASLSEAAFGTPYEFPGTPPRAVGATKVEAE